MEAKFDSYIYKVLPTKFQKFKREKQNQTITKYKSTNNLNSIPQKMDTPVNTLQICLCVRRTHCEQTSS